MLTTLFLITTRVLAASVVIFRTGRYVDQSCSFFSFSFRGAYLFLFPCWVLLRVSLYQFSTWLVASNWSKDGPSRHTLINLAVRTFGKEHLCFVLIRLRRENSLSTKALLIGRHIISSTRSKTLPQSGSQYIYNLYKVSLKPDPKE